MVQFLSVDLMISYINKEILRILFSSYLYRLKIKSLVLSFYLFLVLKFVFNVDGRFLFYFRILIENVINL
jgi:hypothetical protein